MKPATFNKIKITTLFLLALSTFYFLPKIINAQTASGTSAIPPRLEITVKPDGTSSQVIKVRNESKEEQTIITEVKDFIVTDNIGTPVIIETNGDNNRWAASSWIQISPNNVKLKPGETKALTLTVMPPANALPGGHYAMVLHSPNGISSLSSTGASVKNQVGTLVYITIPGDINQDAKIESFEAPKFSEFGPIDFNSTIKNLSDIHIQPVGAINVKNWLGWKTAQINLNPENNNIFPYTTRDFNTTLNKKWLFGRYQATLQASYGSNNGLVNSTISFWVIPWRLLILIGVAIAIIVILILIKKKQPKNKRPTDEVAELEKELEDLKKKYKDQ
ncbi:MAG: hypothetical protein WDA13_02130 [Candidatus Shapirobacteria bacterium]